MSATEHTTKTTRNTISTIAAGPEDGPLIIFIQDGRSFRLAGEISCLRLRARAFAQCPDMSWLRTLFDLPQRHGLCRKEQIVRNGGVAGFIGRKSRFGSGMIVAVGV